MNIYLTLSLMLISITAQAAEAPTTTQPQAKEQSTTQSATEESDEQKEDESEFDLDEVLDNDDNLGD